MSRSSEEDHHQLVNLQDNLAKLREAAVTKNRAAAKFIVAFLGDPRNVRCLDRSSDGPWKLLVDLLLNAIGKDLGRYENHGKKLTPELYDALLHVVLAAEACSASDGNPRRLERRAKTLFKTVYETLNLLTGRETSTHTRCLDHGDETKKIGRAFSRILLKLLEPQEYYASELSAQRCGNLLMLFFDLLQQAHANTCTEVGKVLCRLVEVCVFGPLGKGGKGGGKKRMIVPRDLESSNIFEHCAPHINDLETILQRIIDWFVASAASTSFGGGAGDRGSPSGHKDSTSSDRTAESLFRCLSILLQRSGPNCIPVLIRRNAASYEEFIEADAGMDKYDRKDDGIGATKADRAGGKKIVSYAISVLSSPKPSLRTAAMQYLRLHLQAAREALPGSGSGHLGRVFIAGDYAADQARNIYANLMSSKPLRKLVSKSRTATSQFSNEKRAQLLLTADLMFYIEAMNGASEAKRRF